MAFFNAFITVGALGSNEIRRRFCRVKYMAVPATITPSAVAPTAIPTGKATDEVALGDGTGAGEADGPSAAIRFVYADERGKLF
jgi:hypothetical protein